MLEYSFSRRSLLALAGAGVAGLLKACGEVAAPPASSPFNFGPFQASEVILGQTPNTRGMPQILQPGDMPILPKEYNLTCVNGKLTEVIWPRYPSAAIYHPVLAPNVTDHRVPEPNPLRVPKGPFPVMLYAHGVRPALLACSSEMPMTHDFTRVHEILKHVASYGCVALAPDLSWLPPDLPGSVTLEQAFDLRARVLLAYFEHLKVLNTSLFAGQLDLSRVVMVGHSTGAGACALAGSQFRGLRSLSYGFIAPYFARESPPPFVSTALRSLLVVHGTDDQLSGTDAMSSYQAAGSPKTIVTIPGANHFGYTHLCQLDNTCDVTAGTAGAISRMAQQKTAGAYLCALLRFYALEDAGMRPYLNGQLTVEGLDVLGVKGIQVKQQGLDVLAPPG